MRRRTSRPTTPTLFSAPQADLGFDPEPDLELDQTPAFDPTEPEPVPDLDNVDPDGGA